jgi:cytochrome c oxidase subunit 2
MACHSLDGSEGVGPSWKGIAGTTRELDSGEKIVADHFYLEESIIQPNSKVLLNYPAIMPSYDLMHRELDEIVEFIESLN